MAVTMTLDFIVICQFVASSSGFCIGGGGMAAASWRAFVASL
jgi:hypothetical protein